MGQERSRVVLIAEDDAVNREILRHILATLPVAELVEACDGREALEQAMARRFDLMIFDQNMPHILGDRVIRFLRSSTTPNTATPVIQFTADADRARLSGAGLADAVLPKPVRADELLAVALRLLRLDEGAALPRPGLAGCAGA